MLSSRLQDAINRQINSEIYSAHLYLSMAAYFETISLAGFASWMKVQHQEETTHALRLFDYVNDRHGASSAARHRSATSRVRVAARRDSGGARTRAGRDEDDQRSLRAGDLRERLPVTRTPRVVRRRAGGRRRRSSPISSTIST